ncbi:MAG TPA: hypothetical protein VMS22_03540 [Candidatus Eisenbacteria bacterium]|nr:hypothetical protein [Candidatus Eisenbacteria bacterium]
MLRAVTILTLALGMALGCVPRAGAVPPGSDLSGEAFAVCRQAERTSGDDARALLEHGVALAERAVAADAADARAHFALFCNLGRRLQTTGRIFTHPFELMRALRALDRAVELSPEDPDVATAKGVLLLNLPHLFGGDAVRGEEWLRHALQVDPHHCVARWYLGDALSRRGADAEARTLRETC